MENKPSHYVYYVAEAGRDDNNEKSGFWTKVGAAWPHKDGKGLSLSIAAVPFNGRLVVRERPVQDEANPEIQTESVAT